MNPENHLIDLHEAREDNNDRGDQEESTFDKCDFLMNAFGAFLDTVEEDRGYSFHVQKGLEDDSVLFAIYNEESNNIYLEDTSCIKNSKHELEKIRSLITKHLKKD